MPFMAQRFMSQIPVCKVNRQVNSYRWIACPHAIVWLKTKRRAPRAFAQVKGEIAVTAGFVPFKVPGSPIVEKTVFPSPLSGYQP